MTDAERERFLREWANVGVVARDDRGELVIAPEWTTTIGAAFAR